MTPYFGQIIHPFYPRFNSLYTKITDLKKNLNIKLEISARFARICNTFWHFHGNINQCWGIKAIFDASDRKFLAVSHKITSFLAQPTRNDSLLFYCTPTDPYFRNPERGVCVWTGLFWTSALPYFGQNNLGLASGVARGGGKGGHLPRSPPRGGAKSCHV